MESWMTEYPIDYVWRGDIENTEVEELHAEAFNHPVTEGDWKRRLQHGLGWVTARRDGELVGFVNVAWDGGAHAFILDTMVSNKVRRGGLGTQLVVVAGQHARASGCEWLHVDFEDHLERFYFGACGFRPTMAGLIDLTQ